jgi:hypothetical protein
MVLQRYINDWRAFLQLKKMKLKKIFYILVAITFMVSVNAQDRARELLIAGFAFSGDNATKENRFPYTATIDRELNAEKTSLTREVTKRAAGINNPNLKIVSGKSFRTNNSDDTLNVVLVLTGETILLENYGNYWKVFVNLRGDALIFNYKEKSVVRTYPLNLAIFDAVEGQNKPTFTQIKNLIKSNILTSNKEGLVSQFESKVSIAKIENKAKRNTFQINSVEVKPEAEKEFPPELKNSQALMKDIVADSLASELTSQTNINLIPPKYNSAIQAMTIQLDDISQQIELKVGEADFLINVSINKLAKVKQQQTNTELSVLYGANTSIQLIQPDSNTTYLDATLRNGAVSINPLNKVSTDDFPAYYDVINSLFKKFATAIKTKEYTWVKFSSGNDKTAEQMEAVSNLIEKGNIK